jgi:phytoene dehydrogenase-like protein
LAKRLAPDAGDGDSLALMIAGALEGHLAHPDLAGTALHLLASNDSGQAIGGLQSLTNSLLAALESAGAEISCGLETTDIVRRNGRMAGLRLADGAEIPARAIISTLDLKRTFLSLFPWNDLPRETSRRVASFRTNGSTARLLLALDSLPERPAFARSDIFTGPIHVAPDTQGFGPAYAAWRTDTVAEYLPITLRFTSVRDPRLCPMGAATLTATVDGVPARLFDGSWTHEKRDALRARVLNAIECVLPGTRARVRTCELMVPPDIEQALGCADGDLWGGEIAADQMLEFRPWFDCAAPRTPIKGLYLAGPSTTAGVLGTCVSGVFAARAVVNDFKVGHIK